MDSPLYPFSRQGFKVNGIDIYLDDELAYLAEKYMLYKCIYDEHKLQIDNYKQIASNTDSATRREVILNIADAMHSNLSGIVRLQQSLKPFVEIDAVANALLPAKDNVLGYFKDYRYLLRDWCGDIRGEKQLLSIENSLLGVINYIDDKDNTLFLGAGTGRIAYDLADKFNEVYATDKSYSMVWHYNRLSEENIEFYEINVKNVPSPELVCRQVTASLSNAGTAANSGTTDQFSKVNYFVADVLDLPLLDQSMSSIFSIYFSDVIALKLWLPEVKRVLKPGGIFVHYGPLDYFFTDVREMLTYEEMRTVLEQNDFEIIHDETVETEHLATVSVPVIKVYKNWLLAAKYNPQSTGRKLEHNSVLAIKNKVKYTIHGLLDGEYENIESFLEMPDGEIFEGASSVLDILRLIDGKRNLNTILENMDPVYPDMDDEQKHSVIKLLNTLIERNIIYII